jgi:hypothetical protein
MGKKLSIPIINDRLFDRGITIIGEYHGNKIKTEFMCPQEHIWKSSPGNVLKGDGCPHCAGQARSSKDIINNQIQSRGIVMIGEYYSNKTATTFSCEFGHIWQARSDSIISGSGCPHCSGKARLTKSIINERLLPRQIVMIGEFNTVNDRSDFQCSSGHVWSAYTNSVIAGHGCILCSSPKYGFDPNKPAWEYGFARGGYLKFGITNDITRRLNEHSRHGEIMLIHEQYREVGQLALDWENDIKRTHGGKFATKEQCPDGYTETLPLSLIHIFRPVISVVD